MRPLRALLKNPLRSEFPTAVIPDFAGITSKTKSDRSRPVPTDERKHSHVGADLCVRPYGKIPT